MNVLFFITEGYHEPDEIKKRIRKAKAAAKEHPTFIRAYDALTRKAFEEQECPFFVYTSQYEYSGEAYLAEVMQAVDLVIVYGAPEAHPVRFAKSKTKPPYDRIYPNVELNLAPKKPVRRKKLNKEAEYA